MDMMILGESIAAASEDVTIFEGFWQPRGGNEGTGAIDVIILVGENWTIEVQSKNSEQADSAATSLASTTIGATGVTKFDFSGALELVRYRIKSTGAGNLHFQLMAPQWVPN